MKKSKIIYILLTLFVTSFIFFSCEEDEQMEVIIPEFNPSETEFNVEYTTGELNVDFNSNVIFYARVEKSDQSWLSYKFDNSCTTLIVSYLENDTVIDRIGQIIVSKSGVEDTLNITQAGNPNINIGGLEKVDLNFTVDNSGGYTVLNVAVEEVAKIPIGATVVMECPEDAGTISLLDATYSEYMGGSPVSGEFKFVWTQEIAGKGAAGMMGILRDGFNVSAMYCTYEKSANVEFTIDASGGYTILMASVEECANIPIGASVIFECSGNDGTISLLNPSTYAEYAGGAPVNGKFVFTWTKEISGIAATSGMMGILRDGFNPTQIYTISVKNDLEFVIDASGGYTVLTASAEDCFKIPIGAAVVFECSSDAGTISLLNPTTYAEYAGGAPVGGIFSFEWTSEIAGITASSGMMGILRDGFDVTSMYCHN